MNGHRRIPSSATRRLRRAVLFALLLIALAGIGCRSGSDRVHPVVLIAADGLEPSLVATLIAQGKLPTLARMQRRGAFGSLKTLKPTLSPIIWTTIATGVGPEHHAINGFVRRAEGRRRLVTSLDRRAKALWNILSDRGRRSWTIGWWATYPAERVRGVVVAQVNTIVPKQFSRPLRKGGPAAAGPGYAYPAEFFPWFAPPSPPATDEPSGSPASCFPHPRRRCPHRPAK
ncbi:MAG: hypothetical protein D6815_12530 [Candidatus Dadabacteria bacterium]|nr:MAG: hypothetical protein D6815_12530 [Candidatus Dadabacteria bacterium]